MQPHQRSMGFAFVLYDTRGRRSGGKTRPYEELQQMKLEFAHGINSFNTHVMKRTPLRCVYCRLATHPWRKCPQLQLHEPDRSIVQGLVENLDDLCLQWFQRQGLKTEEVEAAQRFIDDFARRFNVATNHSIEFRPFGSLMSGFGAKGCDIDLCVQLSDGEADEALQASILHSIYEFCLKDEGFVEVRSVPKAKVPIINFRYQLGDVVFHGDVSCSNQLALHNTQLLNTYSRMDDRVAPFVLAIKQWFKVCDLNDASAGTFSSYAITIMALHFLQQTSPPILACLQDETHYELPASTIVDQWNVRYAKLDAVRLLPPVEQPNPASVGQLFIEFFDFVEQFDWAAEVVQIRQAGRRLMKIDKDWTRAAVAIEDPFELSHNLTSGVRSLKYMYFLKAANQIRHEFRNPASKCHSLKFDFESFADLLPKKP